MDDQLNFLAIGWNKKVLKSERFLKEMGHPGPGQTGATLVRQTTIAQPTLGPGAGESRTPLSSAQVPVGVSESALSRTGQEHGAALELVWIGQPLHGPQETPGTGLNRDRRNEDNTC